MNCQGTTKEAIQNRQRKEMQDSVPASHYRSVHCITPRGFLEIEQSSINELRELAHQLIDDVMSLTASHT